VPPTVFAGDPVGIAQCLQAYAIWWQQHHIPHLTELPVIVVFVCCVCPGVQGCAGIILLWDEGCSIFVEFHGTPRIH